MIFLPDLGKPSVNGLSDHVLEVRLRGLVVCKDTELMPLARDGIVYPEDVRLYLPAGLGVAPRRGHGMTCDHLRGPEFGDH